MQSARRASNGNRTEHRLPPRLLCMERRRPHAIAPQNCFAVPIDPARVERRSAGTLPWSRRVGFKLWNGSAAAPKIGMDRRARAVRFVINKVLTKY